MSFSSLGVVQLHLHFKLCLLKCSHLFNWFDKNVINFVQGVYKRSKIVRAYAKLKIEPAVYNNHLSKPREGERCFVDISQILVLRFLTNICYEWILQKFITLSFYTCTCHKVVENIKYLFHSTREPGVLTNRACALFLHRITIFQQPFYKNQDIFGTCDISSKPLTNPMKATE